MQDALVYKCQDVKSYIQFISHFGPALTGMANWNNYKNVKNVSELLTIMDEAFIHLCIINYSATWEAQEKQKLGDADVEIPVRIFFSVPNGYCTHQQMANTMVAASLLGSPKLPATLAKLATLTASNC